MRNIVVLTVILAITTTQGVALASIPNKETSIQWYMETQVVQPQTFFYAYFNKEKIDKYVPYNLTPTTNDSALAQEFQMKMGQKIVDDYINDEQFKNSRAGRTVTRVQEMTNKSVSFGNPESGVVHTFKFQMKAVEGYAQINYSGFFDSDVTYNLGANNARISISKPLSDETSISFVETTNLAAMDFNPNLTFTFKF